MSAPHRASRRHIPSSSEEISMTNDPDVPSTSAHPMMEKEYLAGIALLALALFLSALLGLWQEQTYRLYGRQWKEALFYGHALSLPFFLPLHSTISSTYQSFASSPSTTLLALPVPSPSALFVYLSPSPSTDPRHHDDHSGSSWKNLIEWRDLVMPSALFALFLNILTQGICVRGVNRLTSRVNAVTVNLVLTVRKAVSLGISVWYYGSGMTPGLAAGGAMVLIGTVLYSLAPGPKGLSTPSGPPTIPESESLRTKIVPQCQINSTNHLDNGNAGSDDDHLEKSTVPPAPLSAGNDGDEPEFVLSATGSDLTASLSSGRLSAGLRSRNA
ncbi:hypothetical protein I317_04187 [Kwoniella heveanensis CBS 569]|uniref:Uncharacterized protein n=1 Tax=Kwoniella heveanensis BCC8398 TaxID=1296120 RepID=A0A1B9GTF4_9TREE|nr:hypothetical protein I316_03807 [Kwoniella heveanensis BCC8398]OCF41995.1 hypothetical protein I317_04187 [Kwoniella heveanensis CBS 569]